MTDSSSSSTDPRPLPAGSRLSGRLRPPSSKSLTQRFYNLALLAPGPTEIARPLRSADCEHFLAGLGAVGCRVEEGTHQGRLKQEKMILEILRYDAQVRQLAVEKGGLDSRMLDFIFGRPLCDTIKMFDIKLIGSNRRDR